MPRRLKIAFVLDTAGGVRAGGLVAGQRIIEELRHDHDVVSVGLGGDIALQPLELPIGRDLIASNSFAFARPDDDLLARAFDRADVVHVQLPFFLGFRALALAHELGVPVVAAHHFQPENVLANVALIAPRIGRAVNPRRFARAFNRVLTSTFYNRAEALICPSRLAYEELRDAGLRTPAEIISNGAPDWFAPLPSRPPHPFTVLTVGRLVPEKRHDVVVAAVCRSRHASAMRLVIAGQGPCRAALERQARNCPAQVELGFQPDEALLRLYQTADLYVHASEAELEGMAALEAMRCGCPSVLCDSPSSATRQFALGPAHLFPSGDAQALADRIDDWFEHPDRLDRERDRTLDAVRDYGLSHTIEAYEALYQRVASPP